MAFRNLAPDRTVLCIRFIQWGVYLVQGRDFKDTSKEGNNG